VNRHAILHTLKENIPQLLAVYAFGSQISGEATAESDLDLAVLVAGYCDPIVLFDVANNIASIVACDVDLVDLRAASTVMQYQIISTGERWWAADTQASLYEAFILSEKTELDTARADLLSDIQQRGTVYGR
jgi:predicted nucleotidyltransferase